MKSKDRKELKRLISENVGDSKALRDNHFEIIWNYNYGDDYWTIEHDGKAWGIEDYLRPSQNQFLTFEQAYQALVDLLKELNDKSISK